MADRLKRESEATNKGGVNLSSPRLLSLNVCEIPDFRIILEDNSRRRLSMNGLITGAFSGLLATIPMTLAMKALHEQLPDEEKYPLPPRLIVENAEDAAGVKEEVDEKDEHHLTLVSHFAYGSAAGAVYGGAMSAMDAEPNVVNGVAYGLGVWTASYLGLLPALGLLAPATEHPARRNALMIAAHVVWGASLGITAKRLSR
jgi:uncharacterized membrane protein YagU involved in acid resistance